MINKCIKEKKKSTKEKNNIIVLQKITTVQCFPWTEIQHNV